MAGIPVQTIRNAYSSTNVTTSAYVELDSALDKGVLQADIFDSSGQSLILALGAAGSEGDLMHIMPGGNGLIDLVLTEGARLSVKAVSASATSGELIINLYR